MLHRMRLDGLDSVTLPFAERDVLAWLGGPKLCMDADTLMAVIKVRFDACERAAVAKAAPPSGASVTRRSLVAGLTVSVTGGLAQSQHCCFSGSRARGW